MAFENLFDENDFLQASKETESQFPVIPDAKYVLEVAKAEIKASKKPGSKSVQVSLGFKITPENEKYVNQYVWWNQNIKDVDGRMNSIGVQISNRMLMTLSQGEFEPLLFNKDPQKELNRFIGTVFIGTTKHTEENGFDKYAVNVNQISKNTYTESFDTRPKEQTQTQTPKQETVQAQPEKEITLAKGMPISYEGKTGSILDFVGGTHVLIKYQENGKDVSKPVLPTEIVVLSETPIKEEMQEELPFEIIQEKPALTLVPGYNCTYKFNGQLVEHVIHSVDEAKGVVVVVVKKPEAVTEKNPEGKLARNVMITDIVSAVPF